MYRYFIHYDVRTGKITGHEMGPDHMRPEDWDHPNNSPHEKTLEVSEDFYKREIDENPEQVMNDWEVSLKDKKLKARRVKK